MANKLYEESCITDIGRAIQIQLNTSSSFSVAGMAAAVLMIGGGSPVLESLSCSVNGTYTPQGNVDGFSEVVVSVPGGASAILVSKSISSNGTYNAANDGADGFSSVIVDIPAEPSATLISMSISTIGTFSASNYSADGFSEVVVDVTPNLISISVSQNGTYVVEMPSTPSDPIGFYAVDVSVPAGSTANIINCLSGITPPLSNTGNIGDLYIEKTQNFRYFRLTITKVRTPGSGCQFSSLIINGYGFADYDDIIEEIDGVPTIVDTIIDKTDYPEEANIHVDGNGPPYNENYLIQNLIDCDSLTKYYTHYSPTTNIPIKITVDMGGFYITKTSSYDWSFITADDKPESDPVSFIVELSADGENWITVDQQTDYDLPRTRQAECYQGHFNYTPSDTFIEEVYLKQSGGWVKAIGTDI